MDIFVGESAVDQQFSLRCLLISFNYSVMGGKIILLFQKWYFFTLQKNTLEETGGKYPQFSA